MLVSLTPKNPADPTGPMRVRVNWHWKEFRSVEDCEARVFDALASNGISYTDAQRAAILQASDWQRLSRLLRQPWWRQPVVMPFWRFVFWTLTIGVLLGHIFAWAWDSVPK